MPWFIFNMEPVVLRQYEMVLVKNKIIIFTKADLSKRNSSVLTDLLFIYLYIFFLFICLFIFWWGRVQVPAGE